MAQETNEQKANEYDKAQKLLNKIDMGENNYDITDALVDMYEWTKKRMIDKACEWIKELMIASDNYDAYDIQENLKDFKQAMKGE